MALADWSKQNRPIAKSAILIDKKFQGWARMFLGWGVETHEIFYDMAPAREWLGVPSEEE